MDEPPNLVVKLGEHPLQNQVILKILFDLMESSATLDDWKNIRLVCKLWHSETLNRWRSTSVLDLDDETPFFKPKSLTRPHSLTASELLIHWQNPNDSYKLKEKPYLNYKLQNQTVNLPFCYSSLTAASVFWSTVGPWMKNLILQLVSFETGARDDGTSELLQFLTDKTPNLEQVTFERLFMDEMIMADLPQDRHSVKCTSVVSLTCRESYVYPFFCFPNLQKVRLECSQPIELANLVFPDFPAIPEQNLVQNSKITHLYMMNCIVDYVRVRERRFHNIKFPSLEHLSLDMNNPVRQYVSDDDEIVNEFGRRMIDNHRETLKVLETFCCVPPSFGDWAIEYPMPVLSKLFLWGNCMDNLDFLRFTPNLTLLHIDLYGFEKKEEMMAMLGKESIRVVTERAYIPFEDKVEASRLSGNLAGVVLPKLEYYQLNYKVSSDSVRDLGEWMPNLKIFKGVLDNSTLPVICEVWPKLEQLHCLYRSEIKDEDVIGSKDGGSKKGVADLKYLTSFHYNSECSKSSLTDQSVKQGFQKMKTLSDLQICVSKDFSWESEDALVSRIQNVKVYRNYSENENHDMVAWKCCRYREYFEYISSYERREMHRHINIDISYSDSDSNNYEDISYSDSDSDN